MSTTTHHDDAFSRQQPRGDAKLDTATFRLSSTEKAAVWQHAKDAGETMSYFLHSLVVDYFERQRLSRIHHGGAR